MTISAHSAPRGIRTETSGNLYDGLLDSLYLTHLILRLPSVGLFAMGISFPSVFGEDTCVVAKKDSEPGRTRRSDMLSVGLQP